MHKKLMAVAVAGALGVPAVALAQSSTVQVFGTIYVEIGKVDQGRNAANTADLSDADFMQAPGNEIGFKGEEKLGGGLSAWFQCTSTADVRGVAGANSWCQRNSALGLKGGFGNFFVGVWDSPFKRTISPTNVGGADTGFFGTAFLLTGDSTTTAMASPTAFKRRQTTSINYDSPNFGGFQMMAMFTTAQASTGTLSTSTADKTRIVSIAGQYSGGPLYVSAGYEMLNEITTTGPNANDNKAWHIGAAYTWGPVRFGGQYTKQYFEAGTVEPRVAAWHLGVDWRIAGPHGLRAAYTKAEDVKGAPAGTAIPGAAAAGPGYRPAAGGNTGADMISIRYVYTFSKRTEFNIGYVKLDNEGGAAYNLGGLNTAHLVGDNQSAFAATLRHTF